MMNKEKLVKIKIDSIVLEGILNLPKKAKGIVIFAHGSGSSSMLLISICSICTCE